jgi:3-dehydroquinate dehydratase type I
VICVSIGEATLDECLSALKDIDFAEVRIDKMAVDSEQVRAIFSRPLRLIATCRPGPIDDQKRKELLSAAIFAGASFVDIETEAGDELRTEIMALARRHNCQVIVSYHNFAETPDAAELERIVGDSFGKGADIVKIACRIRSLADNARLLGLLDRPRPLIVLGLGPLGKISRIVAPFLGSPFTYASLAPGKETAEGQIDHQTLRKILRSLKDV